MAFTRRLCVVGILPHLPGEQVATPIGDGGLEWLFDPAKPASIASFWRDSTGGLVELTADSFGWRSVEGAAFLSSIQTSNRNANSQAACDLVTAAGVPVGNYDALVVVIGGRAIGAGAAMVSVAGRSIPCAFLDDRGQHDFICHEVGHAIGMDHSFRPSWYNPGYTYGEYGDPCDIMSARTFGGYHLTHAVPFDPSADIAESATLWTECGPGVATATLWRYLPGYPAIPPWAVLVPAGTWTEVMLESSLLPGGTRLAVMAEDGGGWWTVEYRRAVGWDQGLSLDVDVPDVANAPGVVIHRVRDLGTPSGQGPAFLPQRVGYESTISVPSAGSDDWVRDSFAVRLMHLDGSRATVLVGSSLPETTSVRIDATVTAGLAWPALDKPVELALTGPTCGTNTYQAIGEDTDQTIHVVASAIGFAKPKFQLSINGVLAGTWSVDLTEQVGQVSSTLDLKSPTGYQTYEEVTREIFADYYIYGNRAGVTFRRGEGAFHASVTVTAAEGAEGVSAPEASVTQEFDVVTRSYRLPDDALEAQAQCESFLSTPDSGGGAALVEKKIAVLVAAAVVPSADRMMLADRLVSVSTAAAADSLTTAAVDAQQAAISVLQGVVAPADPGGYRLALASTLATLVTRLLADDRQSEAVDSAGTAAGAYQTAAGQSGVDPATVVIGLTGISTLLTGVVPIAEDQLRLGHALRLLAMAFFALAQTDQAAAVAQQALAADLSAAAAVGSDPVEVAPELTAVAGALATVGLTGPGVDAQLAVVTLLEGVTPDAADRAEHLVSLAEAYHNLVVRLTDDHRRDEIPNWADRAISAYRAYAAVPGADAWRLNRDLTILSKQVYGVGLTGQAVDALRLLVDVLRDFTPAATDRAAYQVTLAEARHNLAARLIDDRRPDEVPELARNVITAYASYASSPGADLTRVTSDLKELAAMLLRAGLTALADQAQHVLDTLSG